MTVEVFRPASRDMIGVHHEIPASQYHADGFGDVPTLSSSIAKLLLDEAPIKAKMAHPRLADEPIGESDPSRAKEIGTAAHKLILGRGRDVVEIAADDYRNAPAKDARAEAYVKGLCPILQEDLDTALGIATAVRARICALPDCEGFLSEEAKSEVVVIARDPSGALLRIMIDRLELRKDGRAIIWDVKTGDQSAAPHLIGARVINMGMELQAAFYTRVLGLALPQYAGRITHRFLFAENDRPHLILPVELDATAREIGRRKTAYAVAIWNRCLSANDWPGYPAEIVVPETPAWVETKWMPREDAFEAQGIHADLAVTAPYVPKKLMEPV